MNRILPLTLVATACAVLVAKPAVASDGPFRVDDGNVRDHRECDFEAWAEFHDGGESLVLAPKCGLRAWADLQVSLGLQVDRFDGDNEWGVQLGLKQRLWRPTANMVMSAGVALAIDERGTTQGVQFHVPLTIAVNERTALNLQAGWSHEKGDWNRMSPAWGVGVAFEATPRLRLLAETFGGRDQDTGYQAGLRYDLGRGLALDLTGGRNFWDGGGNTVTAGISVGF